MIMTGRRTGRTTSGTKRATRAHGEPATTTRPALTSVDEAKARRSIGSVHAAGTATGTHVDAIQGATQKRSSAGFALVTLVDATPQVTGWNFDWDDNIFFMPTKIHLYDKTTGAVADVSTADFALVREQVGAAGVYKNFELRSTSLADFGDDPSGTKNHFVDDVAKALTGTGWRGPSWAAFVKACSRESTAAATTIITARLHAPATIYAGLVELQRRGMLKYLPKLEHIFPVSSPALSTRLGGSATTPSAAKAIVMGEVLDGIQARGLKEGAYEVLDPSGVGQRPMHLWGFSDDDYGNFTKAVAALSHEMKKRRWPDVKITVIFTGKNHPTVKPHAIVLQSDGSTRAYLKAELDDVARLLGPGARRTAALDAT